MTHALLGLALLGAPADVVEIELYLMPPGRPVTVEGVRYQAFTFSEYKTLISIDQKLKAKVQEVVILEGSVKAEEIISRGYLSKSEALDSAVRMQRRELDRIGLKWEKADDQLQKAKAGSIWSKVSLLGGGILAVLGGIALLGSAL